MKSEKQQRHLEKMRAAGRNPEADEKRRQTMKRRWREDPSMARTLRGLRDPAVQKLAGQARVRPLADRFWEKVAKREDGCWEWTGCRNAHGYGRLNDKTGTPRILRATHVSMMLAGNPRPDPALHALHSCDHPWCVNPDHLRWGTAKDNSRDAMERGRLNLSGLAKGRRKQRTPAP